tara:strand:- start:872 stop:997 length:126 start_codon:yes stop_codon:yes gene_type:complete
MDAIEEQRENDVYEAIWAFRDAYGDFRKLGNKKFARRVGKV